MIESSQTNISHIVIIIFIVLASILWIFYLLHRTPQKKENFFITNSKNRSLVIEQQKQKKRDKKKYKESQLALQKQKALNKKLNQTFGSYKDQFKNILEKVEKELDTHERALVARELINKFSLSLDDSIRSQLDSHLENLHQNFSESQKSSTKAIQSEINQKMNIFEDRIKNVEEYYKNILEELKTQFQNVLKNEKDLQNLIEKKHVSNKTKTAQQKAKIFPDLNALKSLIHNLTKRIGELNPEETSTPNDLSKDQRKNQTKNDEKKVQDQDTDIVDEMGDESSTIPLKEPPFGTKISPSKKETPQGIKSKSKKPQVNKLKINRSEEFKSKEITSKKSEKKDSRDKSSTAKSSKPVSSTQKPTSLMIDNDSIPIVENDSLPKKFAYRDKKYRKQGNMKNKKLDYFKLNKGKMIIKKMFLSRDHKKDLLLLTNDFEHFTLYYH